MLSRVRTKTHGRVDKSLLKMTARYIGSCICGALIEPGDIIQFDKQKQNALCWDCAKKYAEAQSSGITPVENLTECQQLIDSYRKLRVLPSPLKDETRLHMQNLLHTLIQEFAAQSEARQFIKSLADCSDTEPDFVAIRAKYRGPCKHCETLINVGQLCLYEKNARRLHCLACDCQSTPVMPVLS